MYCDNGIYKWKYETDKEKEDVYTSIIDKLNIISTEKFNLLSEIEQMVYVNKVVEEIRKINIFPIYYFNEKGIKKEILSVRERDIKFTENKLITQAAQGLLLLDFLFPNLHLVDAGNSNGNCVYNRFYDDIKLKKCIRAYMSQRAFVNMRTPFFTYGRYFWNTATNFAPIRAKAIYERFCPKNGVILDYSAGYGGRMLGALASQNNYFYYGIEPNKNTIYNLNRLGNYIKGAFGENENRFELINSGSEDYCNEKIQADFIFSCPPFFGLERYSDEPTQSINKYPQYTMWLKYYARETIKNCRKMIKDTGLFGIDVIDFYWKNKKYNLVNDWLTIIQEEGFEFLEKYPIITHARKEVKENNTEFIYLFRPITGKETPKHFYGEIDTSAREPIPQMISIYDTMGILINISDNIKNIIKLYPECSDSGVRLALKNKKIYKNKFFRYYNIDDNPLTSIDVPYLCEIDNIRFNRQVQVAEYCGVTKQAVSSAKLHKAKLINGKQIKWFIN